MTTLFCETRSGSWPVVGPHWFPRPRVVDPASANARWFSSVCDGCGCFVHRLTACLPMASGDEVTTPDRGPDSSFLASWDFEVSFDGGARTVRGQKVAGASAIVWRRRPDTGELVGVLAFEVSLPHEDDAQVGEAWGLRLGLEACRDAGLGLRRARIVGDNLGVMRYGASSGRLHGFAMQGLLEAPLTACHLMGWDFEWLPVRRRFNKLADAHATHAVMRARELHDNGHRAPYVSQHLLMPHVWSTVEACLK